MKNILFRIQQLKFSYGIILFHFLYGCNSNGQNENAIKENEKFNSNNLNFYNVGKISDIKKYKLPKEENIYLDSRFNETYDEFVKEYFNSKPNFAGYFIVESFGCGTCCSFYQIIDTRTGNVYSSPTKTDWEEVNLNALYSKESNLFIVTASNDCIEEAKDWQETIVSYWDDTLKCFIDVQSKKKYSCMKNNSVKSEEAKIQEKFPSDLLGTWSSDCTKFEENPFEAYFLSFSEDRIIGNEWLGIINDFKGQNGKYELKVDVVDITTDEVVSREIWKIIISNGNLSVNKQETMQKCE